ncbi:MAG: thiosulfate oxidation carrier complex protein SoxZ [Candidatus Competibacterales bacterium]|nr:thiosulfate oxidation carrier complex protein SoxZ [Candidatus Competibacterales bacterium]
MAGDSIRIRTRVEDDVVEVKALISHPMETGIRHDASGAPIPAHYIRELVCRHNGEVVMRAYWGTGIARNPYIAFRFRGGAPGDALSLGWTDNRGDSDTLETVLS